MKAKVEFRVENTVQTKVPKDYNIYKEKKQILEQKLNQNTTNTTNTTSNTNVQIKKRLNRTDEQFRQIFMKTGVITQASGSSYIEIENTKVICSVHGPRASLKTDLFQTAKFNCELKYASFSKPNERTEFLDSTKEKDYAMLVQQSIIGSLRLEKYPKTVIDLYILVLNDDGGVLVASICAASLALADAGIEMYDMVSACSSVCPPISINSNQQQQAQQQGRVLLDPTLEEEEMVGAGNVLVAKMPSLNEITQLIQTGELPYATVVDGIDLCTDGCDKIYSIMKQNLIDSLQKQMEKNNNNNDNMKE